jgi:hypothetical protein
VIRSLCYIAAVLGKNVKVDKGAPGRTAAPSSIPQMRLGGMSHS